MSTSTDTNDGKVTEVVKSSSNAASNGSGGTGTSTTSNGSNDQPLYITYPVNSTMELTLAPDREVVQGLVYATDEISKCIVLKKSLKHTTLASEIRICNAASVLEHKILRTASQNSSNSITSSTQNSTKSTKEEDASSEPKTTITDGGETTTETSENDTNNIPMEAPIPLPVVSKKALDERERRAMRLAEESFAQINQKASPEGQAVFDRLLKACNEVVWKDQSIYVLNQIRVDPPYSKDDCKLLLSGNASGSLNEGSLERVKKIVASSSSSK